MFGRTSFATSVDGFLSADLVDPPLGPRPRHRPGRDPSRRRGATRPRDARPDGREDARARRVRTQGGAAARTPTRRPSCSASSVVTSDPPRRVRIRPAALGSEPSRWRHERPGRRHHRHLLRAVVLGPAAAGHVVPYRSPAEAEAAGFRACLRCRPHRRAPDVRHRARAGVPGRAPHHRGRARRSPRSRPGGGPRRVGPSPAPAVRRARGHHSRPAGAEPSHALRPPPPGGHRPVGDRHRVGQRLRQPAAAQPREPAGVPRATDRAASAPPARRSAPGRRRPASCGCPYRGALDWDVLLDYFATRAIAGVEHVDGGTYRRTDRGRRPPGRPRAQPRGGGPPPPPRPPGGRPRPHPRRASGPGRSSPSIATRRRPTRGSPPIRCSRRSWRRGPACACPAPGTPTRPVCAPSWASR